MARTHTYTPRRRLLMQAAMLAILAVVVGLAALLRNHRLGSPEVALTQEVPLGPLVVSVPSTWQVRSLSLTDDPPLDGLQAEEQFGQGRQSARVLVVAQTPVPPGTKAEDFLWAIRRVRDPKAADIEVAGQRGIAASFLVPDRQIVHLYAVAILPGDIAVMVNLQVPESEAGQADLLLLERIAGQIRLQPSAANP